MVVDAINFNGEFDMLEIRLNILSPYVDEFIIVEADCTFSGLDKELFYPQQIERYKDFWHKISYRPITRKFLDDNAELNRLADSAPTVPDGMHWWHREFRTKESIKLFLTHLKDDDIVYVSDCDEIWRPQEVGEDIYKLQQIVYAYWLNNRSSEVWAGTFVTRYKNIKTGILNHMRCIVAQEYKELMGIKDRVFLPDGGWHFTSMGGVSELKRKIESYGHQELNIPEIKDNLEYALSTGRDFIGRDFTYTEDTGLWPQYLKDNREKYKHLCK